MRQIADQIRSHSATGALAPGDRLPSVRQLARELAVNQNTILRVYERLTAEGLLERRHGDGTYLSPNLPRNRARIPRQQLAGEVDRLANHAIDLGVSLEDLGQLLTDSFARVKRDRSLAAKETES